MTTQYYYMDNSPRNRKLLLRHPKCQGINQTDCSDAQYYCLFDIRGSGRIFTTNVNITNMSQCARYKPIVNFTLKGKHHEKTSIN